MKQEPICCQVACSQATLWHFISLCLLLCLLLHTEPQREVPCIVKRTWQNLILLIIICSKDLHLERLWRYNPTKQMVHFLKGTVNLILHNCSYCEKAVSKLKGLKSKAECKKRFGFRLNWLCWMWIVSRFVSFIEGYWLVTSTLIVLLVFGQGANILKIY